MYINFIHGGVEKQSLESLNAVLTVPLVTHKTQRGQILSEFHDVKIKQINCEEEVFLQIQLVCRDILHFTF